MTKVVAIMSMSLDGYVADANDGVAEVFDWYFSGDVEISMPSTRSDMRFHVSAPSADHVRGLMAEVGAMLTGRRTFEVADGWGGQHPFDVPAFVATHEVPDGWPRPGSTVQFVTDGIESAEWVDENGGDSCYLCDADHQSALEDGLHVVTLPWLTDEIVAELEASDIMDPWQRTPPLVGFGNTGEGPILYARALRGSR
jgi:dihydrofolate reductase